MTLCDQAQDAAPPTATRPSPGPSAPSAPPVTSKVPFRWTF